MSERASDSSLTSPSFSSVLSPAKMCPMQLVAMPVSEKVVYVLPEPVYPYANIVQFMPFRTCLIDGAATDAKT